MPPVHSEVARGDLVVTLREHVRERLVETIVLRRNAREPMPRERPPDDKPIRWDTLREESRDRALDVGVQSVLPFAALHGRRGIREAL